MIDSGASDSRIDERFACQLQATLNESDLRTFQTMNGPATERTSLLNIQISGTDGRWYDLTEITTKPKIKILGPRLSWRQIARHDKNLAHISRFLPEEVAYPQIKLILGLDAEELTASRERIVAETGGLVAIRTLLG